MSTTVQTTVQTAADVLTSASTPLREVGICTTCNHQATCLFLKATRRAVWYCDEFDAADATAPQFSEMSLPKPSDHYYGEAIAAGLCVNCDARQGCSHRKPGVTVVECENYL